MVRLLGSAGVGFIGARVDVGLFCGLDVTLVDNPVSLGERTNLLARIAFREGATAAGGR
jgi:hypothetical protein